MAQTSGTYLFNPSLSELVLDAYARIQMFAPSLQISHVIEARRSMNLWLSEISGNVGVNLAQVVEVNIPLTPLVAQFNLPANIMQMLDVYVRMFANNGPSYTIGNPITPMLMNGRPALTSGGDPVIVGIPSNTLSATAGSQNITMRWPAHGLLPGDPIFWLTPVTVGLQTIQSMSIVDQVIDSNNLVFLAPAVSQVTSTGMGATPLYATGGFGVPLVGCILPGHGLSVGDNYTVHVATTVGGMTIPVGTYPVQYVSSSYEFYFNPTAFPTTFILSSLGQITTNSDGDPLVVQTGGAVFMDAQFENNGFIGVGTQSNSPSGGYEPTDIIMFPLSRTDYASLPQKFVPGRPTSFYFNRNYPPTVLVYPVAPLSPPPNSEPPPPPGFPTQFFFGMMAYCLRSIQDANPLNGQVLDMPNRALEPFTAALAAKLAEKYKPAMHATKLALAEAAWNKFANADIEHVQAVITPNFSPYYR